MSDSDDDYLDEYVQSVLSHAIDDLNMGVPREYNVDEHDFARMSSSSCQVGQHVNDAGGTAPVNDLLVTKVKEDIYMEPIADGMKRSFSSPAIPDLGSRLCHRSDNYSYPVNVEPYTINEDEVFYTFKAPFDDDDKENYPNPRSRLNDLRPTPGRTQFSEHLLYSDSGSDSSFEKLDVSQISGDSQAGPVSYNLSELADPSGRRLPPGESSESSSLEQSPAGSTPQIIRIIGEPPAEATKPLKEVTESLPNAAYPASTFNKSIENKKEDVRESQEAKCIGYNEGSGGKDLESDIQEIEWLKIRLAGLVAERDDIVEYMKIRDREWCELSERMSTEIVNLRKENTSLMSERISKGGRLSKRMVNTLIQAKQDSDKSLTVTLERQQKINELRLLVTMQQRYIMALEENVWQLQDALERLKVETTQSGEGCGDVEKHDAVEEKLLDGLPQHLPEDRRILTSVRDVINCDRSDYIPGTTTNPELAMADAFGFAGGKRKGSNENVEVEINAFNPLNVPYVRGGLSTIDQQP